MKYGVLALFMLWAASAWPAESPPTSTSSVQRSIPAARQEVNTVKIRLTANGKATTASLLDSPTTRDFVALLPITLKLDDYASTEKIAYLPKKLSAQGAPAGIDPDVGDITYYAPWGNLAIFYRDFGYSEGLVKLGHFDAGIETFDVRGALNVTIELISK